MHLPIKFHPNPISNLSTNARKLLNQLEARKQRKVSGARPKVN